MRSRESFNQAAELYDEVRPSYPTELIDWVIKKSGINHSDTLLEIAPGTGQCTKKFAEKDFTIHAVELGDNLARLLMKNMEGKNVTVDVSPFETWESPKDKKYKLIYCATAWHWIDPEVKYKKTADLLTDDGRLAIIWNNGIGGPTNPIIEEAYKIMFSYHKETPHSTKPKTAEEVKSQVIGTVEMLEESKDYELDDYFVKTWSFLQPKERLIKGFYSQSSFLSLSKSDKEELKEKLEDVISRLEENVETFFKSVVYLLKKRVEE